VCGVLASVFILYLGGEVWGENGGMCVPLSCVNLYYVSNIGLCVSMCVCHSYSDYPF
jgi:hypothetical protein